MAPSRGLMLPSILGGGNSRSPMNPGTVTYHDFCGGWTAFENELNMNPRYSIRERNVYRGDDGAKQVRWGTQLFADFGAAGLSVIAGIEYYNGFIVAVDQHGVVAAADIVGRVTILFNTAIASGLKGAPAAWSATVAPCFAKFNGKLVIVNGIDKPLVIDSNLVCQYLSDPVSGSNANVPNASVAVGHTEYMVLASGSMLYISNKDSIGTFAGAPNPNDAITIDMGPHVRHGSTTIVGLDSYLDRLIVSFDELVCPIILGTYSTDAVPVHKPTFDQPFDGIGSVSQNTSISMGNGLRFCDIAGVTSLTRSQFVSLLNIGEDSTLVNPPLRNDLSLLTVKTRNERVFAVWNKLEAQYMLFVPLSDTPRSRVRGYIFAEHPQIKVKAWSEFHDWAWTCGCSSPAGSVFFARDAQVFLYGSRQNPIYADYVGAAEPFSDGTAFTDGTGFTPIVDIATSGIPIKFDWITPWDSFNARMQQKATRYISFDTQGTAQFTVRMYVDNFFLDRSDPGESFTDGTIFTDGTGFIRSDPLTTPSNQMDFVGGDNFGFGGDPYGELYSGGRIAQDERLWAWTAKFKLMKLRISGYARSPLKIISISLAYNKGTIRR